MLPLLKNGWKENIWFKFLFKTKLINIQNSSFTHYFTVFYCCLYSGGHLCLFYLSDKNTVSWGTTVHLFLTYIQWHPSSGLKRTKWLENQHSSCGLCRPWSTEIGKYCNSRLCYQHITVSDRPNRQMSLKKKS